MNQTELCNKIRDIVVADDWEEAGDEALVASVAERQKKLVTAENLAAAEQEQLKIDAKPSGSQPAEKARPEIGDGPIRLLRRPQSGSQLKKTAEEEAARAAAAEAAQQALEEKEARYQEAREKIFGTLNQVESSSTTAANANESASGSGAPTAQGPAKNHLSDVPMKRADFRKTPAFTPAPMPFPSQPVAGRPPPLMSMQPLMPSTPYYTPPPQLAPFGHPQFAPQQPPPPPPGYFYTQPPPQFLPQMPVCQGWRFDENPATAYSAAARNGMGPVGGGGVGGGARPSAARPPSTQGGGASAGKRNSGWPGAR